MTSPAVPDPAGSEPDADTGLLAPGWTGSPAASATGDRAYLRALLDAEAALTR
ncbi:3-carboxy-cis,cis-muconate cycloisomerase, partial [Streptomyces anthocyanicus]|nr:3-carboxy-cis,cis-muconate cycloisomerase [Streptomyces rubrogriseus]